MGQKRNELGKCHSTFIQQTAATLIFLSCPCQPRLILQACQASDKEAALVLGTPSATIAAATAATAAWKGAKRRERRDASGRYGSPAAPGRG